MYNNPIAEPPGGEVPARVVAPPCTAVNSWCLEENVLGELINFEGNSFTRQVFLSDTANSCLVNGLTDREIKQVRVVVSWQEGSGTKIRSLTECLTNQ
jgi:hypothetical protein